MTIGLKNDIGRRIAEVRKYISGSLPVLYITTDNSEPVTSKEEYLNATYYLDPKGVDGVEALGSVEKPLPLLIKGHGNVTWNSSAYKKKPYRLKLGKKAALLGMNKSKHWVLMAHIDDDVALFQTEIGFYVSRKMGMAYTPTQLPVELVLNGDYLGLYFIAEKVRVEENRVDIVEQDDEETDPEKITGGWLLEINNYTEPENVNVPARGMSSPLRICPHTPEELSEQQVEYLTAMINNVDSLINLEDKTDNSWEEFVDIDALAKFYVINEVLYDCEAFAGSCYFYKEKGEGQKIYFGPVWDFGFALRDWGDQEETFLYNNPKAIHQHNYWIQRFVLFPHFMGAVQGYWEYFMDNVYQSIPTYLDTYIEGISEALKSEYKRWPKYHTAPIEEVRDTFKSRLARHINFLREQWPIADILGDVNDDTFVNVGDVNVIYSVILGVDDDPVSVKRSRLLGFDEVNVADISKLYSIILSE